MFLSGIKLSNDQRKSQDLFSWKATCSNGIVCQGKHSTLNWQPRSRWFLESIDAPDTANIVIERLTCGFQLAGNSIL